MVSPEQNKLMIITGMSGAGKSTALKALEDCGFETIDNLPLSVLETVILKMIGTCHLAVGVDSRTHGFKAKKLGKIIDKLSSDHALQTEVVFLSADESVLIKRFSETRRRHHMATDGSIRDALMRERQLLEPVLDYTTVRIDTSQLSVTDARLLVQKRLGQDVKQGMNVTVMSFGYSKGVPRGADLMFDVRFLRNPHYEEELRPLTGQTAAVQNYVRADTAFAPFVEQVKNLLEFLLPKYEKEGKSYVTIAFGCTGGKHRSVMMAESFAKLLHPAAVDIHCWHRDIPDTRDKTE